MKNNIIIFLVLVSISRISLSQSNRSLDYYDSLKAELIQETNNNNINMIHDNYINGTIKRLYFITPIDSSTNGCEWLIGPYFHFYKSGQLKLYLHTDPKSHACDSLIGFYSNGEIKIVDIYPNNPSNTILNTKALGSQNCESQYYMPNSYLQKMYFHKKNQVRKEFTKYISVSEGSIRIVRTVSKKFYYKKRLIKIKEKLPDGQVIRSMESMD